jgi:hypothetical protein
MKLYKQLNLCSEATVSELHNADFGGKFWRSGTE